MKDNINLLFKQRVSIFYPIVGLNGQAKLLFYNSPYIGLADINFSPGGVSVRTVNFDDKEEVDITIFQGIPNFDADFNACYSTSGIITVGDKGLELFSGTGKEAIFPWPSGLTDVLIVLDSHEVLARQVRTITFYAEPYTERVRRKFLDLFVRPVNE